MKEKKEMNEIRKRMLQRFQKCIEDFPWTVPRDLIIFSVCSGYLLDVEDEEEADFDEIIFIVDKKWLYSYIMVTEGFKSEEECYGFLRNEYTSDDSCVWLEEAEKQKKIAAIDFR